MDRTNPRRIDMASRIPAATLAVALLMALPIGGAIAQTPPPTPTGIETITVVAPRITYRARGDKGSVVPVEVTVAEKSATVRVSDLDLTRTADLYTLEGRVSEAAATVCGELATEYPEGQPETSICTRRAVDDAMARVQQVARQANR